MADGVVLCTGAQTAVPRLCQPNAELSKGEQHNYLLFRQIASASIRMAEPLHCRLSTVQNADEVLVMENGTIVERGTHSELLAKGELARCCHHPDWLPGAVAGAWHG